MRVISKESCFFSVYCFTVYAPDMPNRLPVSDFVGGLLKNILRALKYWFHYTLVALAWLGVVPITACKYRVLFNNFAVIQIKDNSLKRLGKNITLDF